MKLGKKDVDGRYRNGKEEAVMLCVSLEEQLGFQYVHKLVNGLWLP